jgi:hypothetical protein
MSDQFGVDQGRDPVDPSPSRIGPGGSAPYDALPAMPPEPSRSRRRTPLVVAVLVVVVLVAAAVLLVVALTGDDEAEPGGAPAATYSAPTTSPTTSPASDGTETAGRSGQVRVLPSADPVDIGLGEQLFTGTATCDGGAEVVVGFILDETGGSLHDLTLSASGGAMSQFGVTNVMHTIPVGFDIIDGHVDAEAGDDIVLSLDVVGDRADGTLDYSTELSGTADTTKQTVDLGTCPIVLEAS